MWDRVELKRKGKAAFLRNYWKCVLVALILSVFVVDVGDYDDIFVKDTSYQESVITDITGNREKIIDQSYGLVSKGIEPINTIFKQAVGTVQGRMILGIFGGIIVLLTLLKLFIFNLFKVGGCKYFIHNAKEETATVNEVLYGFTNGAYLKNMMTLFCVNLFTFLWTLLLVVPGMIKAYEYRMIPYLLADHPEITRQEAFAESRRLMDGQKWNAFVLDFSFIGWYIVSAITANVAGVFFVNPYKNATDAELYLALTEQGTPENNDYEYYYNN